MKITDPKAPVVNVPAGGVGCLRAVSGVEGALYQAEHFIRRIGATKAIDMDGWMVDVNFPMLITTGNCAAGILLAAVSVMTQCPIRLGTVAVGELASDGVLLPVPDPTRICGSAARIVKELGVSDCDRIIIAAFSADVIIDEAKLPEDIRHKQPVKVNGIEIVSVQNVAELLIQGLEWEGQESRKDDVVRAIMTPCVDEKRPSAHLKAAEVLTECSRPVEDLGKVIDDARSKEP